MIRMSDRPSRWGRAWRYSFPILLAVSVGGCGASRGDVSGKVTYQGKPVVCGSVTLVGADGRPVVARIQPDSSYEAKQIPVGPVQVAVMSLDPARPLNPFLAGGRQGDADADADPRSIESVRNPSDRRNWSDPSVDRSKWFPLPRKYELVHTSGLTAELHRGENTVNLDLQ